MPPQYVGYEDDPLPPEPFRFRFRAPREPQPAPPPAAEAPAPEPRSSRPAPTPPQPAWTPPVPAAPPPPMPVAEEFAPPPPPAPRQPSAAPRPARILRPVVAPRPAPQAAFPTWRATPAPVASFPTAPAAPAPAAPASPRLRALRTELFWRAAVAAPAADPVGYLLGWTGLPADGPDFLMTGLGRTAWAALGGPEAMVFYWLVLGAITMALAGPRLRRPLLWFALAWWGWQGLRFGGELGLLPFHMPPLPTPV